MEEPLDTFETMTYINQREITYTTDSQGFNLRCKTFKCSHSDIESIFEKSFNERSDISLSFNFSRFLNDQKTFYDSDADSTYDPNTRTIDYILQNNAVELAERNNVTYVITRHEEAWLNDQLNNYNFVENLNDNYYLIYANEKEVVYFFDDK